MLDVSIIIPIFNIAPFLERCLESCINQTFKNIEIICVNDGSTDDSLSIIKIYAQKDDRIIIVDKPNEGLVSARKAGVAVAQGKYLFHLDGDDYIPLNSISILYDVATKNNAAIVRGNCCIISEQTGEILGRINNITADRKEIELIMSDVYIRKMLTTDIRWNLWGNLIRRDCYVSNVFVPKEISVGEDLLAMLQLLISVNVVYIVNDIVYCYLQRSTSIMNSLNTEVDVVAGYKKSIQYLTLVRGLDNFIGNQSRVVDIAVGALIIDYISNSQWIGDRIVVKENLKYLRFLYRRYFLFSYKMHLYFFKRSWKGYLYYLLRSFKIF